ncbi:hypothetical protein [Actinophytocola sp. NPDC049390]|uniref:hypothetical protein n=1 Tax=Actinophytocola sp. NPDC049390 TaxID=3363894 RepID=UPI00378ADF92
MPSPDEAFAINLDSLTTFTHELGTQLSGMAQPKGHLDALTVAAMLLGTFGEAQSLRTNHDVAVDEMSVLVGQARDAIDFAAEITKSVTTSYEHYDDEVAAAVRNAAHGVGPGLGPDGLPPGIGNGLGNGIGNAIGNGLGGHVVDSIVEDIIGDEPHEQPGGSRDDVVEDIVDALLDEHEPGKA